MNGCQDGKHLENIWLPNGWKAGMVSLSSSSSSSLLRQPESPMHRQEGGSQGGRIPPFFQPLSANGLRLAPMRRGARDCAKPQAAPLNLDLEPEQGRC
jgi:hypothetical protein